MDSAATVRGQPTTLLGRKYTNQSHHHADGTSPTCVAMYTQNNLHHHHIALPIVKQLSVRMGEKKFKKKCKAVHHRA
jgi:hypothetical protein